MLLFRRSCLALLLCSGFGYAQTTPAAPSPNPENKTVRIYVSDRDVKSVQGGISSFDLFRELNAKCTSVVLTDNQDRADFRLEAGYAWCCTPKGESRGYKFALFNRAGDAVFSTKTHTLANAVKNICNVIGREKAK